MRCHLQISSYRIDSQNLQYKTHPEFWPSHRRIFKTSLLLQDAPYIRDKTVGICTDTQVACRGMIWIWAFLVLHLHNLVYWVIYVLIDIVKITMLVKCSINQLAEWRSGSVSALPCEQSGFSPRTRLREIIPANNCTMQGQNNWGNWGSLGVMKLWVAWEVLRWLKKFRELCSGGFHPKLVTPPYHGFLNVNTPPNSQNSKQH